MKDIWCPMNANWWSKWGKNIQKLSLIENWCFVKGSCRGGLKEMRYLCSVKTGNSRAFDFTNKQFIYDI